MKLRTEFVEHMPEKLEEGVLYISMEYAIAIHLCPCGCGNQSVTPFYSPETGWTLTVNDGSVTLSPSILNMMPCRSHYWIRDSEVVWAS